jgi:hypothetical protein
MPDGSWGGDFLFRWSRFEYSETTDAQPYDIHLRGFKSPTGAETTWYDAADIYKQWAKNQFWCKKTFLEKTDFLPPWTREAPVLMRFNREWFDRPDFMYKWLDEYWKKKFPDAPLLAIFEGWEKHGDWIAPDYFPVYPSDEKFAEIISRLKAVNGHFWPWPGGHHWNIKVGKQKDGSYKFDFSKDFWERASPHAVYGPDGKVALKNLGWLGGGYSASMCAGDMWSVNWWNKDIACELVKRGADLVQLDQDVGARIEPTCWATNHAHKPGPGRWLMHAQRHQVETMISEMRKINPDAMFSFEEMHEYFADLYAFADYRNCRWMGTEWASVYNYIYHEYTPTFQSGFEQHSKMFWLAHCAADGQMPRLPMALKFYENPTDEQKAVLDFVERWIVFHRGEGRKWLAHGRQLHPPRVECDTVAYHEKFRGEEIDKVMPAVFSSAWAAQDKTRALVFVNATAQSRTLAYKWNNKWSKIEIEPYGLKLIQVK